MTRVKHCQKERHHDMAKDQPREIVTKVRFGPPKRGHFHVGAVHQLPVPDKAKAKDKNEHYDECDQEFYPVHKFFSCQCLANPQKPWVVIAKFPPICRSKLSG